MIQAATLKREERGNPYPGLPIPDTIREQTKQVSELSDLLGDYAEFLDKKINYDKTEEIVQSDTIILTPKEIDDFLQDTNYFKDHENYRKKTGIFISQLIQTSYNAGNNNFNLNTENLNKIDELCVDIKGEKEKPIKINIKGDSGEFLGLTSTYCIYNIEGNMVGGCGLESENNIFHIKGTIGYGLGAASENCTFHIFGEPDHGTGDSALNCIFNIHGDAGDFCGVRARKSNFNIRGKVGNSCGNYAENSTFSTFDTDSYKKFQQYVSENNTIFLKDKKGNTQKKTYK